MWEGKGVVLLLQRVGCEEFVCVSEFLDDWLEFFDDGADGRFVLQVVLDLVA